MLSFLPSPRGLRGLTLVAVVVSGFARSGLASPLDTLLDGPLADRVWSETRTGPTGDEDGSHRSLVVLRYTTFWSGVQLLGAIGGRPVRLPAELAEWPGERTETDFGREVGAKKGARARRFFDTLCLELNLAWSEDAADGVINLRPAWWRDDPRSNKELMGVLLDTRPAGAGTLRRELAHWPSLGRLVRDPWRLAFDALLSRPENFAQAGALRLYHDNHGLRGALITDNLCATPLTGSDGRVRTLVLNYQPSEARPSLAGDVAYYLFDEEGRFLRGGVYSILPHACEHVAGARVEVGRVVTVVVGYDGWGPLNLELHFGLVKDDLVLQGSTQDGVERNAADTEEMFEPEQQPVLERRCCFPVR